MVNVSVDDLDTVPVRQVSDANQYVHYVLSTGVEFVQMPGYKLVFDRATKRVSREGEGYK